MFRYAPPRVQDRKEDFVLSDPAFVHLFFASSIEKAWAQELVEPLIALRCFFQRVDVKALSSCYLPKSVSGLRPPCLLAAVAQDPSLTEEES